MNIDTLLTQTVQHFDQAFPHTNSMDRRRCESCLQWFLQYLQTITHGIHAEVMVSQEEWLSIDETTREGVAEHIKEKLLWTLARLAFGQDALVHSSTYRGAHHLVAFRIDAVTLKPTSIKEP